LLALSNTYSDLKSTLRYLERFDLYPHGIIQDSRDSRLLLP
jgi:hypothetical protein